MKKADICKLPIVCYDQTNSPLRVDEELIELKPILREGTFSLSATPQPRNPYALPKGGET